MGRARDKDWIQVNGMQSWAVNIALVGPGVWKYFQDDRGTLILRKLRITYMKEMKP